MFSKLILGNLVALGALIAFPSLSYALETPSFPVCVNPQGELKVSYDSGVHGIVGTQTSYSGSDKVYNVSENQLIQCFCAEDGSGIQTNWLKVGSLSESEQKAYVNDGYIYISNGDAWGLEDTGYVAKNLSYSCRGSSQGSSGTGSSGGTHQGTSASVNQATGGVFGLASTGNVTTMLGFFFSGVVALILGLTLRKKSS